MALGCQVATDPSFGPPILDPPWDPVKANCNLTDGLEITVCP